VSSDGPKSRIRLVGRSILFWGLFIIVALPIVLGSAIFITVYSLAMLGPWVAGKVSLKGRFRGIIDLVFGVEQIHEFRGDIQKLIWKNAELEIGDRSAFEIREDIYETHENAVEQAERGEFIIAIVAGAVSLLVGSLTNLPIIGLLLGVYSVLMTLTIGLQVVVLDILAFDKSDDLTSYRRQRLVLYEAWNRVILFDNGTQASVLAVGLMYRISPSGYEIAKDLLEEAMGKKMNKKQQMAFVAGSVSTIAAGIIRGR